MTIEMSGVLLDNEPSPDLLREHAYLVARGVRSLAVAGWCRADELSLLRAATIVELHTEDSVLPFVLDHQDGSGTYGYAAARWALDLYEWSQLDVRVPQEQRSRILGLLLGYSQSAVTRFEEQQTGRRFGAVRRARPS